VQHANRGQKLPDVQAIGGSRRGLTAGSRQIQPCTIVVMVLRNLCLSEQSCAETRRNLGSFRSEPRVLAVAIASRPHRLQGMPLPKPNWACSLSPICRLQVYAGRSSSGTSS
jgi:hypothetical protein